MTVSASGNIPTSASITVDPWIALNRPDFQRRLGEPFDEKTGVSRACFATLSGGSVVVACGYWDNSIKCFSADTGRYVCIRTGVKGY